MADDNDDPLVTKPFKFVTASPAFPLMNSFIGWAVENKSAAWLLSPKSKVLIALALLGYDARFPNQNQTKHCWQNYVDYHKCINAKGEDFKPCRQFFLAYRSLCPSAWCERWDDQRENGVFPADLE
ncbi:Cytochrome c oxidase subunit 6B [Puttea exsequens]|nr:Cytochrome c oxidase subunit 6B [Puttea exsequens]